MLPAMTSCAKGEGVLMKEQELDLDKIDEVALAIISLTLHGEDRAWKGLDWAILDRLHQKGWIGNPVGKAKSVQFTDEGLVQAERLRSLHFETGKANVVHGSKDDA